MWLYKKISQQNEQVAAFDKNVALCGNGIKTHLYSQLHASHQNAKNHKITQIYFYEAKTFNQKENKFHE